MNGPDVGDRIQASIHIGGVWASRKPSVVRTILGSCISVCLRDPITQIGGMNHFMLPDAADDEAGSTRYGVNAMEILINRCMQEGAERRRLVAKVFGGGHVLKTQSHSDSVPQKNIGFAFQFLETEGIPVVSKDTGGLAARSVLFFTDSGRIMLKRMSETGADASKLLEIQKRQAAIKLEVPKPAEDDVTLF